MQVIHFIRGATDPLRGFEATGACFLPLAEGFGNSHISCLHLGMRSNVLSPSLTHAVALLVVHGHITVTTEFPETQIDIHAGMGAILDKDEPYSLTSEDGAILLIVESDHLIAQERAISTPQRIAGQSWPGDTQSSSPSISPTDNSSP